MRVKVEVEYCSAWGYGRKVKALELEIKKVVTDVELVATKGRRSSFEVTINGELVYSKLSSGKFPDYKEIAALVQKASKQ